MTDILKQMRETERRIGQTEVIERPGVSGTFTPAFGGSTTNGTISYDTQTGRWTRIANLIICRIHINTNTITTQPTGNLQIINLPFTSANVAAVTGPSTVADFSFIDLSAGNTHMGVRMNAAATTANLTQSGDNIGASFIQGTAMTGNDVEVVLILIYEIA